MTPLSQTFLLANAPLNFYVIQYVPIQDCLQLFALFSYFEIQYIFYCGTMREGRVFSHGATIKNVEL